jgi:hypothetical protein
MTEIMQRATELAEKNTPGVAFAGIGIFLENMFLGVFKLIGLILGRTWFHGSQLFYAAGLAFADGYRSGTRVARVPQQPSMPPYPGQPDLMDDDRIIDQRTTPFGVPYGPNVQAYSERA